MLVELDIKFYQSSTDTNSLTMASLFNTREWLQETLVTEVGVHLINLHGNTHNVILFV